MSELHSLEELIINLGDNGLIPRILNFPLLGGCLKEIKGLDRLCLVLSSNYLNGFYEDMKMFICNIGGTIRLKRI